MNTLDRHSSVLGALSGGSRWRRAAERAKAVGRTLVRAYCRMEAPGRTRLRMVTDSVLCPQPAVEVVKVGGYRVSLDHASLATRNMAYASYEVGELRWIRRLLRRGDVVLDAGGNVGYMAAHFATMVGRSGKVYSFEPSARAYAMLKAVADSSESRIIEPLRVAVSDRCGRATFYETDAIFTYGYSRLDAHPSSRFVSSAQDVEVTTLDEFARARGLDAVAFVKLDVEGHEHAALQGMTRLLASRSPPILMTEITNEGVHRQTLDEYAGWLRARGYRPHTMRRTLAPLQVERLSPGAHINVLWLTPRHRPSGCR